MLVCFFYFLLYFFAIETICTNVNKMHKWMACSQEEKKTTWNMTQWQYVKVHFHCKCNLLLVQEFQWLFTSWFNEWIKFIQCSESVIGSKTKENLNVWITQIDITKKNWFEKLFSVVTMSKNQHWSSSPMIDLHLIINA